MFDRRDFVKSGLVAVTAPWLLSPRPPRQARSMIIDGLGEIRIDYEIELLDEIRASGMHGCVITVGNPALHGPDAFLDMRREIQAYDRHIATHPDRLSHAISAGDFDRAAARGTIGLLYYTQNTSPIGDDIGRLDVLKDLGVRIIQLTYNTRNLVGDGCLERTNAGLSTFGIELVDRLNELGMLIDVSHCGPATTLDGIGFSEVSPVITHAGCRTVFDHPRNKTDEALRALADKGGVIGIYQINPYIGPNERNTLDDYLAHIDHAINVAGIDHVGVGSDREHRRIPDTEEEKRRLIDELAQLRPVTAATFRWPFFVSELNHPRRMETIRLALERRGRTTTEIEKILGGNFYRLFKETIG